MTVAWYQRDPLNREYEFHEEEQTYDIDNKRLYLLNTDTLQMLATISYQWSTPTIYFDYDPEDMVWYSLDPTEHDRWLEQPEEMWMERLL